MSATVALLSSSMRISLRQCGATSLSRALLWPQTYQGRPRTTLSERTAAGRAEDPSRVSVTAEGSESTTMSVDLDEFLYDMSRLEMAQPQLPNAKAQT